MKGPGCHGNDRHNSRTCHLSDGVLGESGPSHKDAQSPSESPHWEVLRPPVNSQHHTASSMALGHPGRGALAPAYRLDYSPKGPKATPPTVLPKLSKDDPPWRMFCRGNHLNSTLLGNAEASKKLVLNLLGIIFLRMDTRYRIYKTEAVLSLFKMTNLLVCSGL